MMANKISYVKNEEPAFIKAFKQKVGYQEGPNVDSKREVLNYEEDDRSDNEEEKPTVVVLKEGDLTAEEVQELKKKGVSDTITEAADDDEDADVEAESDGKIKFKKPVKRQNETKSDLQTTSSKKQKSGKEKKKTSSSKVVKNSSLLSFGDEEEDEET